MKSKIILMSVLMLTVSESETTEVRNWETVKTAFVEKVEVSYEKNRPGYVLAIANKNGIQMLVKSGAANIEQGKSIDENTVFHVASLSKQITAAVLAHAILDKKVSLEDKVLDWLPETHKFGEQLKVKHLVYMTSGLTEYTHVPRTNKQPWSTFHYFSIQEAIRSSLSIEKLRFDPGSQWQYSNINYMLITEIIAEAYQKPFSLVAKEKLFLPLKMSGSLINDDITQIIPNRANAYFERSEGVLKELNQGAGILARKQAGFAVVRRNSPHYGGSGLMTSINDWARWNSEMLTHKVFGESFWSQMFATMKFKHDKDNDAFGLVHGAYKGVASLWYEGGDIDSSAYSVTLPKFNINISCFSNNPLDNCREKVEVVLDELSHNDWAFFTLNNH